ncbi:MAG: aminotransferase class V-fold PLP-dependent enzyme [Phycisphaerales bacterium]
MVYLDHASTSYPKAPGVAAAMGDALGVPGSAGRGTGAGSGRGEAIDDALRSALAATIGADEPSRVVLTPGATASLNMAINGVALAARGRRARARRRPLLVTTQIEHNAVRRPLLALAQRGDIDLRIVAADSRGRVEAGAIVEAARGAELVAMAWASNATGAILPVQDVGAALAGTNTLLLVDGSQTVGVLGAERSLRDLGIDLLAFSGHKALHGPAGVGVLYVGPRAHPLRARKGAAVRIDPWLVGGTGVESVDAAMPADLPTRFEPGTRATVLHAGLLSAIEGRDRASDPLGHARRLRALMVDGLAGLGPRVRVHGETDSARCVGVVPFTIDGFSPDEAAIVLGSEFGIVVRAGLHCAPGAHEAMGTLSGGGTLRASVGEATTEADVRALVEAVGAMAGVANSPGHDSVKS